MIFSAQDVDFSSSLDFSDTIHIKSSRKVYDVNYTNKSLDILVNEEYQENDFIFIDRNVYNLSPTTFTNYNNNNRNIMNFYIFDASEDTKTMDSVLNITDLLYSLNFTKQNKIIIIGGGITQDVGGFAAGLYKRGINWIYIPTTILSMTDSCIGSKVSVNRISKNILSLFVAPNKIIISDFFLKSLSDDDIISGVGEAFKLSLIGGDIALSFFYYNFHKKDYISIIKMASLVKKQIIEYDEFEQDVRNVLNYGHTIGHAIEGVSNYFIPHGIAVLIGMYIENSLFDEVKYSEINKTILNLVNPKFLNIDINYSVLKKHILSDKKNRGNNVCFIFLENIGSTKIVYKSIDSIEDKLKEIIGTIFRCIQ
jgi:3-dehydroquinate synthase